MKEQIQVPFDNRGEDQEKGNKPKGLSRPALPKGLEKPKLTAKELALQKVAYMGCSCGNGRCNSPTIVSSDNVWTWVYFDKDMKRVNDRNLPKQGDRFLPPYF